MASSLDSINWILWSGTVGLESPIPPRIPAAVDNGYTRLSVSTLDVFRAEESGVSARELGKQIRGAGLGVVLDPVMGWYPGATSATSRFARFTTDEALRMSEDLEITAMTAIATPNTDVPVEEFAAHFGVLCDRVADLGAVVHLEFIPMTVVSDLAICWDIVRDAGRPNGGIVLDSWHFFRGNPDFDLLATIPGERIFAVQLDDAYAEVVGTMREDTQHRLLPGAGSFDLPRLIRALADIDALTWVGPEVIHPDMTAMPAMEGAKLAGDRTRALVASALSA